MSKQIIIHALRAKTQIAIVDEGQLVELHEEDASDAPTQADIYLGRIKSIRPDLESVFVDIGQPQKALLNFQDLQDNLPELLAYANEKAPHLRAKYAELDPPVSDGAAGAIEKSELAAQLKKGQRILVQVIKKPVGSKGPRVKTGISIPGRTVVLLPLSHFVGVSKNITSKGEKNRLYKAAQRLRPKGFGLIVRQVAMGKDKADLKQDLRRLLEQWRHVEHAISAATHGPAKVHADMDMVLTIVRDRFRQGYDRIVVDHPEVHLGIRRYLRSVAPHMAGRVRLHEAPQPIFEATGIQDAADEAARTVVQLPSGGNLVIEETEAMYVIDVNSGSGKRVKRQNKEESALRINLEAARAVARQIRLRDMGGITVVDFINQDNEEYRKQVCEELKKGLEGDKAISKVLPMREFGLVEIARQRTGNGITPRKRESRHGVNQNGHAVPEDLTASIEKELRTKRSKANGKLTLHVHPFAAAYLLRGIKNPLRQWQRRHKVRIKLKSEPQMGVMDFRLELPSATNASRAGQSRKKPPAARRKARQAT